MLTKEMLIARGLIPLDKSWMMRVGLLDIIHGYSDIIFFLEEQFELSDDLAALLRAAKAWSTDDDIDVGESGTLYRFLRFASWKLGINKNFIRGGTLRNRKICDDPHIITLPLTDLLTLDNGTSQWASAAVLFGNNEHIKDPPYKLALTYEARDHWMRKRAEGAAWLPQYDETILEQADAFSRAMRGEDIAFFTPKQPEDYCFARAFELITPKEAETRWPSLRGHETDRIEEMEEALRLLRADNTIRSRDHRVVQALAMRAKKFGQEISVDFPDAVDKSWPQFWRFLNEVTFRNESMETRP